MSWLERTKGQSLVKARRVRLCFALLPALFLAGCLHPLYGTTGDGAKVSDELKAIEVAPIPQRLGHYLGDELIFALNGTGAHVTPRYRLIVTTSEGTQTALVDTVTGLSTGATVVTTVHYTLVPIGGGPPITHGTAFATASYDRTPQRFSDMRAARDAEQRDARVLADQIRTQLAQVLAYPPPPAPPPALPKVVTTPPPG